MGRPRGMKKIDGIWYMPNGEIAPSSKSKVNNAEGYSDTTNVITVAQKPAESVTGVSTEHVQSDTPNVANPPSDNRIKAISVHLYSSEQLEQIAAQTGQILTGFFGEADSAVQVPVFLNANQSEEDRKAKLTKIRRGI